MAWKKLAFTDEVMLLNGTQAMSGTLDMSDYNIIGVTAIQPSGTTVTITGILDVDNHKITSVADPASAQDATTKAWVEANTVTNPMTVDLDMGQQDIANVTAIRPYDSVGVGIMMEDANGVDQVEFGIGNGSYAMVAYRPIDMNQKAFDGMVFGNLATAPHAASEVQGEAYYNTVDDHIHVWVV